MTASSVRVRSAPAAGAREVGRLDLGTIVTVIGRSPNKDTIGQMRDFWYRVTAPKGVSGWVFGGLTADFNASSRESIYRKIGADRLKTDKLSFEDNVDLVRFIEKSATEARQDEARAELELFRLLAIKRGLETIPFGKENQAPYAAWIKRHSSTLAFSEIHGQHLIRADAFWNLRKKYQHLAIADRIAWEAAQTMLGGECEGYVPCHVYAEKITSGEYLRLYPNGAYAAQALESMAEIISSIAGDANKRSIYTFGEDDAKERAEVRKNLDELRKIVGKASAAGRDAVLRDLERIATVYK